MKNNLFSGLVLFTISLAFGQMKTAEIGVVLDNDLYTSTVHDQYYTNGVEFFYRFLEDNSNLKINKQIKDFRIGQYIYNPQTVKAENYYLNDRPFAGYLFFEAGVNNFYQNESVLKLSGQLGIVGPSAFGEEVQKFIHNTFGYDKVQGWQYQIVNNYAIQAEAFYSHKVFKKELGDFVDFHVQAEAKAGTIWNSISGGMLARIGFIKLLPVYDSNLHHASISSEKKEKPIREFYLYISPNVNYQIYDATIQGGFFDTKSPVTFEIIPWRFNFESGIKYRKNNWNLSYSFVFRGKELYNNVITSYYYGSIGISHLL